MMMMMMIAAMHTWLKWKHFTINIKEFSLSHILLVWLGIYNSTLLHRSLRWRYFWRLLRYLGRFLHSLYQQKPCNMARCCWKGPFFAVIHPGFGRLPWSRPLETTLKWADVCGKHTPVASVMREHKLNPKPGKLSIGHRKWRRVLSLKIDRSKAGKRIAALSGCTSQISIYSIQISCIELVSHPFISILCTYKGIELTTTKSFNGLGFGPY